MYVEVYFSMSVSLSSMFTMQDLDPFISAPKRLFKFLRDRFLLSPLHIPCTHSTHNNLHFMGVIKRSESIDGLCYYCNECRTRSSLRMNSIFFHSTQDLL